MIFINEYDLINEYQGKPCLINKNRSKIKDFFFDRLCRDPLFSAYI